MPRQTCPRVSSDARLGFSFQLPLPQHVVEFCDPNAPRSFVILTFDFFLLIAAFRYEFFWKENARGNAE